MKEILLVLGVLCATSAAVATEAPGYETTERIVPHTTHAIVGLLASCTVTNEPGNRVLAVKIISSRSLWGGSLTNSLDARYTEFVIPSIPEGMSVSFANYSGSGIEWNAKPRQEYICLLKREGETFSLLRLEPVANEKCVLAIHAQQKAAPSPRTEKDDPRPMPLRVSPQIAPGVFDITKEIAGLLCEGISITTATLDVRPSYCDAPSVITAELTCDDAGTYTVYFDHPRGTSQSPISLSVRPPQGASVTNVFKVFPGCPMALTNRQSDTLVLKWRGAPGRGPAYTGWFLTGVRKQGRQNQDKAVWEQHRYMAQARSYTWLSRSQYVGKPWFVDGESLVYEGGELVGLRYPMRAVRNRKATEVAQEPGVREPTHIVRYSFTRGEWTLISPQHSERRPYREALLTRAVLLNLAERYAIADEDCRDAVTNILLYVRADTSQRVRTVDVSVDKRTVRFVENGIPYDGPVTTVTVVMNENGTLASINKDVRYPCRPEPLPRIQWSANSNGLQVGVSCSTDRYVLGRASAGAMLRCHIRNTSTNIVPYSSLRVGLAGQGKTHRWASYASGDLRQEVPNQAGVMIHPGNGMVVFERSVREVLGLAWDWRAVLPGPRSPAHIRGKDNYESEFSLWFRVCQVETPEQCVVSPRCTFQVVGENRKSGEAAHSRELLRQNTPAHAGNRLPVDPR